MPNYSRLTISFLQPVSNGPYQVQIGFEDPESSTEQAPEIGTAKLQLEELMLEEANPQRYGELLAEGTFADADLRAYFRQWHAHACGSGLALRVRIMIDPSAIELAELRWELLVDPDSKQFLTTNPDIFFSRGVTRQKVTPARRRPKRGMTVVVAVAAPTDIGKYGLSEVNVEGEIESVVTQLGDMTARILDRKKPVTLERLMAAVRQKADVLYLVCHGYLEDGKPRLYLQREDGTAKVEEGQTLVSRLSELTEMPRLIVLVSCESAGTTTAYGSVPASLATLLAQAGLPTVVAMQGRVEMATTLLCMPVFFRELVEDGQIDRAMGRAREVVRERPDFWMPVLYTQVRDGCLWTEEPAGGRGAAVWAPWVAVIVLAAVLGGAGIWGYRKLQESKLHETVSRAEVLVKDDARGALRLAMEAAGQAEKLGQGLPGGAAGVIDEALQKLDKSPQNAPTLTADMAVTSQYVVIATRSPGLQIYQLEDKDGLHPRATFQRKLGLLRADYVEAAGEIAVAMQEGEPKLEVVRLRSGEITSYEIPEGKEAVSIALRPDGEQVCVGLQKGYAVCRGLAPQNGWTKVGPHLGEIAALAFSERKELAMAAFDGRIAVYGADGKKQAEVNPLAEDERAIGRVVFRPGKRQLLASNRLNHRLGMQDMNGGKPLGLSKENSTAAEDGVRSLSVESTGELAASGSGNGCVRLWNLDSRSLIREVQPAPNSGGAMARFVPGKKWLVVVSDKVRIHIYDPELLLSQAKLALKSQ